MIAALMYAVIVGGLVFVLLMIFERWLHKLTKNRSKAYRAGVWVFAILIALYTFATQLGR